MLAIGEHSKKGTRDTANDNQSPVKKKVLDDSDATSMTTTSTTGTPSPYSNNDTPMNTASLSRPSSAESSPSCSGDETPAQPFSILRSLLSSPRRVQSEPVCSSELSPSNCLDITPQLPNTSLKDDDESNESEEEWTDDSDSYDHDNMLNSQTPRRRGSPWSIQQALFQEEETESRAPVSSEKSQTVASSYHEGSHHSRRTSRRSYHRSVSDSPTDYDALQPPPPIRTRRSYHSVSSRVDHGFQFPEHRRRSSAGSSYKSRASPKPLPSSSLLHDSTDRPLHSQHHVEAPHSHSKTKKFKRGGSALGLDLPGLLEERLNLNGNSILKSNHTGQDSILRRNSGKSAVTSSLSPPSPTNWRGIFCRLRLTSFVWGLLMIGLTSLGRVAMLTSGASWEQEKLQPQPTSLVKSPAVPTAGLRGSLLLATVKKDSHSTDSTVVPKKALVIKKKKDKKKEEADKKKKRDKTKEKQKTTTKKDDKHGHKSASATKKTKVKHSTGVTQFSNVAQPPPLDPFDDIPHDFDEHDTSMFQSSSPRHMTYQRVVMLHDDVNAARASTTPIAPRRVQLYPAEFTDNTQFYGLYDSDDERLRKMEIREPYSQGECVPMQDWQTNFHPSCNAVHELGIEYLGEQTTENDVNLFGTKGYWRYAWRLDLRKQAAKDAGYGDTVVLKTLKYQHNFEDAHFEHDRVDAVAMERLTSSPHVINVFGFCGHSVLTEFANGPRLGQLADKSKSKPLSRLKIARDIANGLADVHGIDDPDGNNATFVHLDINPANVVSIGGTLKLNDFNIGIIRRWNTTSQKPCGFPAQYPNPQWRSPEESRNEDNLTEKVDVFSLGHIFFRLICGHEPWNKLEPGGRPPKEVVTERVQQGKMPFIPDEVMKTEDPEVAAIRDAMLGCYKADPNDRPKAREIAKNLEVVLKKLAEENTTLSH